ncbi:mitogen-activated protein kinase kinase kinase YODA-like isoform X2 [Magnolia sinica]|uniref:mitogen-activated protein kinase kinase kinase YODA-like isoform X2 n=1 Tax=Magnolia sinica TaxID=86752 RepID=UPI00265B4293|nr:mitogen-activated protein kinase kinase kinase YODA-like isoform X2 [Magnolia sinica]
MVFSDSRMPRTCPISPIGSPLLLPRSPQHMNGKMSSSSISSPRTTSGLLTPLSNGAVPFHHLQQYAFYHDGFGSTLSWFIIITAAKIRDPIGSVWRIRLLEAMEAHGSHLRLRRAFTSSLWRDSFQ